MKTILCLGVLAMLVGCDGSKVELESAKTNLATMTRERDDLKVQVATLEQQLTTSRADLAKAKAAEPPSADKDGKSTMAAKSSPAASSTASPKSSKRDNHAHKS